MGQVNISFADIAIALYTSLKGSQNQTDRCEKLRIYVCVWVVQLP